MMDLAWLMWIGIGCISGFAIGYALGEEKCDHEDCDCMCPECDEFLECPVCGMHPHDDEEDEDDVT